MFLRQNKLNQIKKGDQNDFITKTKKMNGFNELNIKAAFNNVSSNTTYVEPFKNTIRFGSMIKNSISYQKAANSHIRPVISLILWLIP